MYLMCNIFISDLNNNCMFDSQIFSKVINNVKNKILKTLQEQLLYGCISNYSCRTFEFTSKVFSVMSKNAKKPKRQKLVKMLDAEFSYYIRLRDSDSH